MTKTLDDNFSDWESAAFGFGYGTGEPHIIPALVAFFERCAGDPVAYDYRTIEETLSPPAAWLLINALCKADIIEYGSSPRFGWLTPHGRRLQDFVLSKTADELIVLANRDESYIGCSPDSCNCDPNGYEAGRVCVNPFWPDNRGLVR